MLATDNSCGDERATNVGYDGLRAQVGPDPAKYRAPFSTQEIFAQLLGNHHVGGSFAVDQQLGVFDHSVELANHGVFPLEVGEEGLAVDPVLALKLRNWQPRGDYLRAAP